MNPSLYTISKIQMGSLTSLTLATALYKDHVWIMIIYKFKKN
jgi:hypothetical protein